MGTEPIVSIDRLELSFSVAPNVWSKAVKGVSIDLLPGEIVGLVGESGSGKSVTSLSIPKLLPRGVSRIDSGQIRLFGSRVSDLSERELIQMRGDTVSVIFQEPMTSLSPAKRIGYLLVEALLSKRDISQAEAKKVAEDLLRRVQLPDTDRIMSAYPFELSGGMRQRVMIAIAFANDPKVLIADEPTTALDVTVQAEILDLIRSMAVETGCAVLFICHDLGVVSELCNRIYVMRNGEVLEEGPTTKVLSDPQHQYTKGLISCLPSQHPRRARLPGPNGPEEAVLKERPVPKRPSTIPAISINGVCVDFVTARNWRGRPVSEFRAVDNISLEVATAETYSIIGESGSGKTTLARVVMGLQTPSSGGVRVSGEDPGEVAKTGKLQIVFQDPRSSLNPRMPAWQIVTEPLFVQGKKDGLRDRAADLLVRSGLSADVLDKGPREFSGGERQRLAIARALSTDPQILVLDEPTSALDASVQAQILNLLLDLQDEMALTYFLITHDMSVVSHISDKVGVMKAGKLIEAGSVEAVLDRSEQAYTRKLLSARPHLSLQN